MAKYINDWAKEKQESFPRKCEDEADPKYQELLAKHGKLNAWLIKRGAKFTRYVDGKKYIPKKSDYSCV